MIDVEADRGRRAPLSHSVDRVDAEVMSAIHDELSIDLTLHTPSLTRVSATRAPSICTSSPAPNGSGLTAEGDGVPCRLSRDHPVARSGEREGGGVTSRPMMSGAPEVSVEIPRSRPP